MAAQEFLHLIMVPCHDKHEALRPVLKNQPDVQSCPDFKKIPGKLANPQAMMTMRMAEIALQLLQGVANFGAFRLRIGPGLSPERFAQFQWLQPARSFSKSPENRRIFPRLRSEESVLSARFSNRASSASVAPYSRHA